MEATVPPHRPPKATEAGVARTWPQRLTIAAVASHGHRQSFAGALVWFAQRRLKNVIEDRNIAPSDHRPVARRRPSQAAQPPVDAVGRRAEPIPERRSGPLRSTFPPAEPGAKNILITGADNNACIDPDSPYAPAFGDRSSLGERSDTIMMWRVNPATTQVAVLSFPRDLCVDIAGTSRKGRINEAYERDNPQKLIDTIYQNFGINTDHFVQVDFCAFKTLVDAVGGVAVPFETPGARRRTPA